MTLAEHAVKNVKVARRDILRGSSALALSSVFASPARAEVPPAIAITPQLIEAAKQDGNVVLYSSMDLPVGDKIGKARVAVYHAIDYHINQQYTVRRLSQ